MEPKEPIMDPMKPKDWNLLTAELREHGKRVKRRVSLVVSVPMIRLG